MHQTANLTDRLLRIEGAGSIVTEPKNSEYLPASAASRRQAVMAWVVVGAIFLLQWSMFRIHVQREIAWAYPGAHDQVGYLQQGYDAFDRIQSVGIVQGFWEMAQVKTATGSLLPFQTALMFLVCGASRLSALTLLFLYFLVLEGCLFAALRWMSGRWSVGFMGLGILLAAQAPFARAGGMFDFRIDFAAFCLQGIVACAVLRSGVFTYRSWSLVAGAAIGALVILRHYAAAHLAAIFVLISAGLAIDWAIQRGNAEHAVRRRRQFVNMFTAAAVVLLIAGPVLIHNWKAIDGYYFQYYGRSENVIRDAENGVKSRLEFLAYYPRSIVDHAGPTMLCSAGLVAVAALGFRWACRRVRSEAGRPLSCNEAVAVVVSCFAVPLAALMSFGLPSPVSAVVCLAPVALIAPMLLTKAIGFRRPSAPPRPGLDWSLGALAVVCISAGLVHHADGMASRFWSVADRSDVQEINQMYDRIIEYCHSRQVDRPEIFSDRNADYLCPLVMRVVSYERHGLKFEPHDAKHWGIFALEEQEALDSIDDCDVVMLTTQHPNDGRWEFPYDACMREYHSSLSAYCKRELLSIGIFQLFGAEVTVFVKPTPRITGLSAGWILNDGLTLHANGAELKRFPTICLLGSDISQCLKEPPEVTVQLSTSDGETHDVPGRMELADGHYKLTIDTAGVGTLPDSEVEIKVRFSSWFVPAELKSLNNGDTRRLVVLAPDDVRMTATQTEFDRLRR